MYIGITVHGENPNTRWENGSGYANNAKFYQDIEKYGWDNFEHNILASNLSKQEALTLENQLIREYCCVEEGYNNSYGYCVPGADGRKKLSEALKNKKKSPESIKKQIQTKLERSGNLAGINWLTSNSSQRVRCKETGDVFCSIIEAENWCSSGKVSECCKGNRAHAGRHPETNELLSWEFIDKNVEVTRRCEQKYSTKKIKKVICLETGNIYSSGSDASRQTGINLSNILRVCNGERKSAGGYHWKYWEEN